MNKGLLRLDLRSERSGQPKYERLKDHLVKEMLAGRLRPGQALPSEHRLVEALGVARMTIRQTMISLENDGLIRRVQGKGNFVKEDVRRKLKRGQDIFALVVPETHGAFYPSLLRGFESAAGEIHHQAIICSTNNEVARQAEIVLQLLDKKVGGVAVVPVSQPPTPAYQIRQLQERGVPVVFLHRRVEGIAAPLLAIPFYEEGRLAGRTLAEHGHRRVALFGALRLPTTSTFSKGLQDGLRAGGCDVPPQAADIGADSTLTLKEDVLLAALQRMFADSDPPTAIVTTFDSVAEMVYLLLPRLGLRVPEDVSLLGFGGAWREGALAKRLVSVVLDEIATGQKAVSLLHEMRRGERPINDDEEIVAELSLSEGETLAAPAGVMV